jgi:glyoxylase-like metal-dependent hydrolase (beta-lactamase superfamily II)
MSQQSPKLPWHPIPPSDSTCKVHLIQAGGLYIPTRMVLLPNPDEASDSASDNQTQNKTFYAPDYVFLIEHTDTGNQYIFDLGMRKDLENLPPTIIKNVLPQFKCEPELPAEILQAHGAPEQQPEHIKAVIFSHMHFDHVGDGAKAGFDKAEMWIGPTCCTYARPGYPVEETAPTLSETLPTDGSRKIIEAFIPDDILKSYGDKREGQVMQGMSKGLYNGTDLRHVEWIGLGAFDRAFDVFGDGAAYLVDAPGHSAGHQMMLLRTTADTFVLLAGDGFHHPDLLRDPGRTARPPYAKEGMHVDAEAAVDTIWRTRRFAERDDVWVIAAHDFSVGESIALGEKVIEGLVCVDSWKKKGWKKALSS